MPSSIPYDPSLMLADIVSQELLNYAGTIAELQAPVYAALEKLNALRASIKSLELTRTELQDMGIDPHSLSKELESVHTRVGEATLVYANAQREAETKTQEIKAKMNTFNPGVESPVDYQKTEVRSLPHAADPLIMDFKYFSRKIDDEKGDGFAGAIGQFISAQTGWLGFKAASEMMAVAQQQVSSQVEAHNVAGTLAFSVSCMHKGALQLAPLVIDPEKGIKAWNHISSNDQIESMDKDAMLKLAIQAVSDPAEERALGVVSGITFGSSFVGLIHVLNDTSTATNQRLSSLAASLQASNDVGGWWASAGGESHVSASMVHQIKNVLDTQNLTFNVTIIRQGARSSTAVDDANTRVDRFVRFNIKAGMGATATTPNPVVADQGSRRQFAEGARTDGTEDQSNGPLDIDSLTQALNEYLQNAAKGTAGMPITCNLKFITKRMLAELWLVKYQPRSFTMQDDDTRTNNS